MSSDVDDILVEIPDADLPELAEFLKEKCVKWAPYEHAFVQNGTHIKQLEKYRKEIIFTSPNNCWRQDGTIIALMKYNWVHVFTLDEKCRNLYNGLMGTKRINLDGAYFYVVHERIKMTVEKFLKDKNVIIGTKFVSIMFTMSPEMVEPLSVESSDTFYIKPINVSHARQINSVWPHSFENSEEYIKSVIEMNGGYGLFLKENHELVTWILQDRLGVLAVLQTTEEYKGKGYASTITKVMSKKLVEKGIWPFAAIVCTNQASINMFEKLGFQSIGTCRAYIVKKK